MGFGDSKPTANHVVAVVTGDGDCSESALSALCHVVKIYNVLTDLH